MVTGARDAQISTSKEIAIAPKVDSMIGTSPEWISAFAAVGALVAATGAALQAKSLFQVESARDQAAAQNRKRTQARAISAWVAAEIDADDRECSYGMVISNSSSEMIFDVRVEITGKAGEPLSPATFTVLPPGDYYLAETAEKWVWSYPSEIGSFENEIRPITKSKRRRITSLAFRDSDDVRWRRFESGTLQELATTS